MNLQLHDVIISKAGYTLKHAKEEATKFIPPTRKYYRETENSYRFRNISKQKFEPDSFHCKEINNNIILIVDKLKFKKN